MPVPSAGNFLTSRQHQQRSLAEYDRQLTGGDGTASGGSCAPGEAIIPFPDGYAIPGPADPLEPAPADEPDHTYPAWHWILPTGTPIYAVRGGRVVTVRYWPCNWGITAAAEPDRLTDLRHRRHYRGRRRNPLGLLPRQRPSRSQHHRRCWNPDPDVWQHLRSSGSQLHLQIRTTDGRLRCPQEVLRTVPVR